jgi:hypothetical protein
MSQVSNTEKKKQKTFVRKPASKKESRIRPVTFALDEKTNNGLVVFETLKDRIKFTVYLNSSLDLALFLQESFKRQESGFVLSKKLIKVGGLKIKKARISELDGDRELVHLFLKSVSKKKSDDAFEKKSPEKSSDKSKNQKVKVALLEVLGLWTLENFPLYACDDFIEKCRDVKIELKETKSPLGADLHRRYGQKYLM